MGVLDRFLSSKQDDKQEIWDLFDAGKNLMESHFYDRASVEFNKALSLDKEFASELIVDLYMEMQGSNPDAMIALGINILQHNPDNIEMANMLGNTYRKKGDYNAAKSMYQRCLKRDPYFKNASYNLAATLARAEVYDGTAVSAIAEFESLNHYQLPDNSDGEEKLYAIQGEVIRNEEISAEGETAEVKDESLMDFLEDHLDGEKVEEAQANDIQEKKETSSESSSESQEKERKVEIDPEACFQMISENHDDQQKETSELLNALGLYCLTHYHPEIAVNSFQKLVQLHPEQIDFQCFLVLANGLEGNTGKAIDSLQKILIEHPFHRYSNVNLGYLFQKSGKTMKARTYFFITYKLLERSGGYYHIERILNRAEEHFNEDRGKKALELYEPLYEEINAPNLLNRIGKLQLLFSKLDEAVQTFRRVLKIDVKNAEAREGLKQLHQKFLMQLDNAVKKHDYEDAAKAFEKAIGIVKNPKLMQRGIDINKMLKNETRANQLERMLKQMLEKDSNQMVQEKISLAEEAEKKGNYKAAVGYYEQAIRISPKHEIMVKMSDFCQRIDRPELAEKVSKWFNQHLENQKRKAALELAAQHSAEEAK
ncbi:MAG: tetratricopeptide repeat protein [SAR324 cluster bacterium]|nr:tetratricopeptide repeat protein [SAR324 cluster bacterium]MEC8684988.1 tetratricopeptide repeat protein [SAR324 cluster bacterium]|tara:strand:- start:164 stop:1954 length:1791 start_codon:yes stop_codon:yes gene_type:complete